MIAIRPKKLLQVIIGAGEIGDAIAVKQARPVATGDLAEVPECGGQRARSGLLACHGPKEPLHTLFHGCRRMVFVIGEEVGDSMYPAIGYLHVGPEGSRRVQPALQDGL
jgi:hypothetical protein